MLRLLIALALAGVAAAATADKVLLVINDASPISRQVGEYYARKRGIPLRNVCRISTVDVEDTSRMEYDREIAAPIAACLKSRKLQESVLYIVTTMGVPLKVRGNGGFDGDIAAVDSELTLLYSDMKGPPHPTKGTIPNPFFGQKARAFQHPDFPIYLVTRLAGYDFADIRGLIDRSLLAANKGKFVIDLTDGGEASGNDWLRTAALLLPKERVVLDETTNVLYDQKDVIGYASWGSNDKNRKRRHLGYSWLPGAIMTEYVSTNARTFQRPPENWTLGTWDNQSTWFAGAPQTMTADYIHEGVTGASGHVYEPFLMFCPRPEFVLPAYYKGRNLAESFYLGIPALSWQNIVVGDPLCTLGPP